MTQQSQIAVSPVSRRVEFVVPGKPVAKGRPRFARHGAHVRTFTPEATERYENLVKMAARAAIHDGSDEVLAAFAQFGERGAAAPVNGTESSPASIGRVTGARNRVPGAIFADAGTAARFFYCAKASRADRNQGVGGSDAPAVSTNATMRDREDADWLARNGNHHPTVKPTELMRYLVRLVTPPGGLVLDPFMGSGSTGKACAREGFRFIGIDVTPEYVEIARARIDHELKRVEAAAAQCTALALQQDLFADAEPASACNSAYGLSE